MITFKLIIITVGWQNVTHLSPLLSSFYRSKESRDLIKLATSSSDDDEIVFCDNPQERICYLLSKESSNNRRHSSFSSDIDIKIESSGSNNESENSSPNSNHVDHNPFYYNNDNKPIIFVNSTEPVDLLQTWIDAGAQVERISENHEGFLDLTDLERRLQYYTETKRPLVGYFTSVSRLTGMLADDVATSILLHQYNALSIWDCSLTVSCATTSMNSTLPGANKDALFFHGKSMVGGVQASGESFHSLFAHHLSLNDENTHARSVIDTKQTLK